MSGARIGQLVSFALLSFAQTAGAEERPLTSSLESSRGPGAESCLSDAALSRAVERRLQRKVFESAPADLSVSVRFERAAEGFRARIELADGRGTLGTRELATEARHCSALDDSLALVVALLVDTPPERTPASAESPAATAAAAPPRPATPIRLPAETYAPRQSAVLGARASATVAHGVLPSLAPGLELGVEAELPHVPRLSLTAGALLESSESLAGRDAGASLSLMRASLFVCPRLATFGRVRFEGCAGQRIGRLAAEGFGFLRNLRTERLYFALALGGDLRVSAADWLDIVVGVRAELPLTRDEFSGRAADGASVRVFRAPAAGVAVESGVGVRF